MLVCLLVFPDTKAEDKNQAEVLLGATDRRLMQADPGSFSDNECQDNGSCSPSYKEKSLLRPQVTARSQRLSLPFWDPDSPTTNRYLISDSPNDRLTDAAWSFSRCRCGGQAMISLHVKSDVSFICCCFSYFPFYGCWYLVITYFRFLVTHHRKLASK